MKTNIPNTKMKKVNRDGEKKCLPFLHKKGKPIHWMASDTIVGETEIKCSKCGKSLYYWAYGNVEYDTFLLSDIVSKIKSFFHKFAVKETDELPF